MEMMKRAMRTIKIKIIMIKKRIMEKITTIINIQKIITIIKVQKITPIKKVQKIRRKIDIIYHQRVWQILFILLNDLS